MFIRNCWYVVAWEQELEDLPILERTVLGESLAIYRLADGSINVLDNRCPHRQAPLSEGRREGDLLRCMYHGLVFAPDGACVAIPGQTRISPTLRAYRYPAVLKGDWVWVWMGDPDKADEALIPELESHKSPTWRYRPGGYMHYDVNYLAICDNLLDFSHASYVHENSLGGTPDIAEARPQVDRIPQGIRVIRHVRNTAAAPYHKKLGSFSGAVDRYFAYDFLLPGVLLMHTHVKDANTPDDDMSTALQQHTCQALTPETENSTHYFFMQAHAFKLDEPQITEAIYQSLCQAFEEDKRMITAQQRLIERTNPKPMQAIQADQALGMFRAVVKRAHEQENGI